MQEKENKGKQLLYYMGMNPSVLYFDGGTVRNYIFKDVKTGGSVSVIIGMNDELSKKTDLLSAKNFVDLEARFDVLWIRDGNLVEKTSLPFEKVQEEYQKMLKENVPINEINAYLMGLCRKTKRR